ncbi:serine hydrolase [Brevibacillus sp. HD3.3A]|uniref:serine hydrolase domain-containing protein n=1 Tax=Brevibacillus sp. HD3.3A TaxID=2738979 RepID=UPI00156BD1D9|nr:serine hydrolase domain-containing protein [Brevibacillus sp. HD3.3A]UED70543.1 beta-lactamase family protein [Brevibacillus sp. HD3.3A]
MERLQMTELAHYIETFMEEHSVPGLAVALSLHGQTIYAKGFGVRDLDTKEPVTPETVFGIASVTKSFTAAAIMQLVHEGKLSLDDPVNKYLPSFRLTGCDAGKIQIRHLLSHTSGVPPLLRKEELIQFHEHLDYLAHVEFAALGEPGQYFSYANDMFLLLGAIIERVTGRLYRRYMTERLLEPLGMHRSTFSLEEVARLSNVSTPYARRGANQQMTKVAWPTLGNYEVGGGIRSSVEDLLAYGSLYVGGGRDQQQEIVPATGLAPMWQPVHRLTKDAWYGYALKTTTDYAGVTLVEHGGGQPGVSSNFGFVPEKGVVCVVLSNMENVPIRKVWLAAVNAALGLPLAHKEPDAPLYQIDGEELDKLVGTYACAEGGHLRLFVREGVPVADVAGTEFALRAAASDTLIFTDSELPLRFFFKADRRAWAVLLGMRMLQRVE